MKNNSQRPCPPLPSFRELPGSRQVDMETAFPASHSLTVPPKLLLLINSKSRPTITASPENYIWGRCLPGAGAERIQAVEGVISAVARRREGVAAFRVPAVDVAAVSDTALRALNVIGLLSQNNTEEFQI